MLKDERTPTAAVLGAHEYADYALWQRETMQGDAVDQALDAWAHALRGAPAVLDLGIDRPRTTEADRRSRTDRFELSGIPLAELDKFAADEGVAPYVALIAAFQAMVARHAGSDDIVLGSPPAGHRRPDLDGMVGSSTDLLVIRTSLADDPTFRLLVSRTRGDVLDARARSRVPFQVAVNHLHPERDPSYNPLVQVVFALHEDDGTPTNGIDVERAGADVDVVRYDITWSVYRGADRLRLEVEYAAELYHTVTVEVLVDHWQTLVRRALAEPDRPLSEIGLAEVAEVERVALWSGEQHQLVTGSVHELVSRSAARWPEAVALVGSGMALTYRELEQRSSAVAHRLRAMGVGPESCVGVCMARTPEMVVACLAILKAGGVYVPLDPTFPVDRMHFMLSDVAAKIVLVDQPVAAPSGPWQFVDLADISADPEQGLEAEAGPLPEVNPANGCYVIFTSGSTGRPKGTTVTHRNVTRLIEGARERLPFGPEDVWSLFHSLAFDVSVWEIWGALTTGGRLVVVPYAVSRNVHEFHELVRTERVTILGQTPSAFRQFEAADDLAGGELSLRAVVFAGEALHRPSVRRWAARHGYARPLLINMYGITETTVHVTYHVLSEQDLDRELTQIGRPLPDLSVYVLDPHGRPCPIGVTGELHVGGAGLSRGYTNRAALTAERFVPDHVSGRVGGLLYRSGDLGRWSAHGGLEYIGRADTQVKIRGYRIETGEIEVVLGTHPRLRESAVIARSAPDGQADLVGYLVPDGVAPPPDELRTWMRKRLPDYMVPRHFVVVEALPLTAQGKLDRRALPEPEAVRPELGQVYEAPAGEVEELLADIWCRVLELGQVGRHDNFFDLGGDSIRSLQVLGMAHDAQFVLQLNDIVDSPTVAGLAATVLRNASVELPGASCATRPFSLVAENERVALPDGLADAYPMAELQVGMIYEMERDRARNVYHVVETLRVVARFDEACFREAVERIMARHPVLRASFDLTGFSEPMQLVHDTVDVPLSVVDLRQASQDEQQAMLEDHVRLEQQARFDLARPPLFRMAIHVLSEDEFHWTITEHHAILDGWSMVSTISEIADLYLLLLAGERPVTEPLRSLYRDFIAAERAALRSSQSREFWRRRLAEPPAGGIAWWTAEDPQDAAILAGATVHGESHQRDETAGYGTLLTPLSAELLRELEDFASRSAVPLKTVLLTAHLKVISLLTGSADVLIGMTANGRLEEADSAEVCGLFLNTVPLRMRLPEGSWQTLARAIFGAERALLPHRRYPMAALQREFGGEKPLFHTNFAYNNFRPITRLAATGRLDRLDVDAALSGVGRTNFALEVVFSHEPASGGLLLEIGYGLRDLTADQVTRLRDSHLRALTAMARQGEAHHRAAPLIGPGEERLLAAWQGIDGPRSDVPIHELFGERVVLWPDAVAVESGAHRLTFAELDARSDALARRLVAAGARRGDAIGLHLRPGLDAVVAVWAVWKAGGAFLPLDPDLPLARLTMMLDDAVPTVLVSWDASALAGSWTSVSPAPDADVPDVALPRVGPRDLAYIMFSSGSTGRPKGIMVEHGNLANFAVCFTLPRLHSAGIGASARILTGTSAFLSDFFVAQLLPLLEGHCLTVLVGPDRRDPRLLVERAQDPDRAVHLIDTTASQVQLMVDAGLLDAPHPPRLITTSGEACPPDLWDTLRSHPRVVAHNAYGPAEVTVDATYAVIGAHESPVIGRPHGNVRVYLVDDGLELVPPGTIGELVIGGPGVGRGYLGQPAATAAAFVPDPWGEPGSRLYRSGDLGRYTADGQLKFLGRNDHQVKVLGQRVELEDVEAALRGHPAVVAAAVSAHQVGADKRQQLVAHLVMVDGAALDRDELRAHLAGVLPGAAIPTAMVTVEALPMLEGGKLNRAALTVPDHLIAQATQRELVKPRTDTEQRIATAWQAVLGVPQVGLHDDFFALGGHSLLAIRLAMRVSGELGIDLPLHEVLSRRTVAQQAALLETPSSQLAGGDDRSVVPLGGTPGARPLVLVHPIGGMLFSYLDLVEDVGTDFEAFGIQGRIGKSDTGATDLSALARRYADELAPGLAGGEPTIAGWSAGGIVAHELARILTERGIRVHRLLLVDSDPRWIEDAAQYQRDSATLDALQGEVIDHGPEPLLQLPQASRLFAYLGVDPATIAELDGPTVASLMTFWRDMFTGLAAHRPAAFDGAADLVLARGSRGEPAIDHAVVAAWSELTGTLRVTHVDGDHFQLLRRPWVRAVADVLRGSAAQTGD